jgi:hypothetical protein
MLEKPDKLLQKVDRRLEVLLGRVCAVISGAFACTFIWLFYLVAWRNPREYSTNDLFKPTTAAILVVLVSVAIGFSLFASRLIAPKGKQPGLMSPMVLRLWALFFGLMGVVILVDGLVAGRWNTIPSRLEIMLASCSMSIAAFVLARKQARATRRS